MTITSSSTVPTSAAVGKAPAAAVDKKSQPGENPGVPFEQLLQGLAQPVAEQDGNGGQDLASGAEADAEVASLMPGAALGLDALGLEHVNEHMKSRQDLASGAEADAEAASLVPGAVLGLEHMYSLVGQTLRLDTQADRAQRDGSFAAHAPALPSVMSAATHFSGEVPVVALGVQALGREGAAAPSALAIAADAQLTQLEQAGDDAQVMSGAVVQKDAPDAQAGRVALQTGVWQLVSPAATAPVAALAGQIGQWAAQWLGAKGAGRPQEQAGESRQESVVPGGISQGGSQYRLTEQAVQAATASERAQNDAQWQGQENLRFWLKGDQQRGELLLQRDGQPVRVQVHMRGNEAHVVFRSDQADLRQLLDAGLSQLGDLLAQQGLALADAQVQPDARQGQSQSQEAPAWGQAHQGWVVAKEDRAEQTPAQSLPSAGRLNVYA